jgi:transmembrane sensor
MHMSSPSNEQDRLTEEAADWCMRVHAADCSLEERAAFARWRDADPRHAAEYEAIRQIWQIAGQLPRTTAEPAAPALRPRWHRFAVAASVAVVMLASAWTAGWWAGLLPSNVEYYASQDERRTVTLPDGSTAELNTRTPILFAQYRDRRSVSMGSGEAFFRVKRDEARPLTVWTEGGSVRIEGTSFNVWASDAQIIVTLVRGSVLVTPPEAAGGAGSVRLSPGMQVHLARDRRSAAVIHVDPAIATAWRDGKLILDNVTLKEALPLINRYLTRPLRIGDGTVAAMRIGGIYNVADLDRLVDTLPKALSIDIDRRADAIVLSARRSER